jgi:hypothetical protein
MSAGRTGSTTTTCTHLGVEKVENDDGGNQKSSPDVDGLDSEVGSILTNHIRHAPLEDNAVERSKGEHVLRHIQHRGRLTIQDRNIPS